MRILIFGDVVGRPGRAAVTKALPLLRAELAPDSVIVNIENLAHGRGISPSTFAEAQKWQADVYTTGDHAWDNEAGIPLLENKSLPIIRPANYPATTPGRGYHIFSNGAWQIAVINLQGQVFFKNHPASPFTTLDALLGQADIKACQIKLVDFQAEATSEKRGLGWYLDGRITALWGTHTHVPTADAQILPAGTGYISDIGMNGNHHSIIGIDRAVALKRMIQQLPAKPTFEDSGPLEIGALLLEVEPTTGVTTKIQHIRRIIPAAD